MSDHAGWDDGRVYLNLSRYTSNPESQVHRNLIVEELVEELRDRLAFLERSLERRSLEAERYQQIVTGLTQTNNTRSARVLELEAPADAPARPQPGEEPAHDAANGAAGPRAPTGRRGGSEQLRARPAVAQGVRWIEGGAHVREPRPWTRGGPRPAGGRA
jgi:hypothetical protein